MKFIDRWLNNLPRKLLFAIIIWLMTAIFFVGLTLNITWKLEDRGVAINEAGSLRKQTYLMISLLQTGQIDSLNREIKIFEAKLQHLSSLDTRLWWFQQTNMQYLTQLNMIKQDFNHFKKDIANYQQQNIDFKNKKLLYGANEFVAQIDHLVKYIEQQNTYNIRVMRVAQMLLIGMVCLSALLSLYLLNYLVIRPLAALNIGLQKVTSGKLSTRLNLQTNDEFAQVSDGFNQMASSLEGLYQHLEDKVQQKTADLARINHELSVLYDMTDFLHRSTLNDQVLNLFLEKIISLSDAQAGSIRLLNQDGLLLTTAYSINLPSDLLHNSACTKTIGCLCGSAFKQEDLQIDLKQIETKKVLCNKLGFDNLVLYHLKVRDQSLGLLTLFYKDNPISSDPNTSLIQLLCAQLATAVENSRLHLKEKQYAVVEERNIMAQGLHDSIAQSLSFMNLQLQMLKQAWKKHDAQKIEQHLEFLSTGLQQCYDDVRELLSNFRLKIAQKSFQELLLSVVERFKAQTNIEVIFEYHSAGTDLTPQQQLQLLFIVQEALSNIRKHAKATQATIEFRHDNHIYLTIKDNGIGFDPQIKLESQGHHIGLSIMQERINQVHGQLHIKSVLQQGTEIEVII